MHPAFGDSLRETALRLRRGIIPGEEMTDWTEVGVAPLELHPPVVGDRRSLRAPVRRDTNATIGLG